MTAMPTQPATTAPLANNHISVDCVVMGWDGERLNVLLVSRHSEGEEYRDMKLPGSLIYQDEDLDQAASRVLRELTGVENAGLMQYKAYGSKDRTRDPRDVKWLERAQQAHVERIVTIAYIALVKIDRSTTGCLEGHNALWMPLDGVGTLAFDHNLILSEAIMQMRSMAVADPALLFELLQVYPGADAHAFRDCVWPEGRCAQLPQESGLDVLRGAPRRVPAGRGPPCGTLLPV